MIRLPFDAVAILFSRPKTLALGFFPGAFTFFLSSCAIYGLWAWQLSAMTLWLAIPFMVMGFLVSWLVFGNLSLIPVEDLLIDATQRAHWGEVRISSPGFSVKRILREAAYSLFLAFAGIVFFFMNFLPVLGVVSFLLTAWMSAYAFLGTLYARVEPDDGRARLRLFFRHGLGNLVLGLVINALLFVPILNVFLLGYAQILATKVFLHQLDQTRRSG